jgi:hypothetical protein
LHADADTSFDRIQTSNLDLEIAKTQNDDAVQKVLAVVSSYGIDPEHVQTEHLSIESRYSRTYEHRDFLGYFVRKTIVVTLNDSPKFEDLLGAVLQAGVNYVHGIDFHTTELRKYRDEARSLAIKAAREKAVALASALDEEIGRPQQITEIQWMVVVVRGLVGAPLRWNDGTERRPRRRSGRPDRRCDRAGADHRTGPRERERERERELRAEVRGEPPGPRASSLSVRSATGH